MRSKKSVLKILSASCDYFEVSHGMAGNTMIAATYATTCEPCNDS